jgi:hypothetical protein
LARGGPIRGGGRGWGGWFLSQLAQQSVYILLNVVGYVMWRKDERLRQELERIEERELEIAADVEEELIPRA